MELDLGIYKDRVIKMLTNNPRLVELVMPIPDNDNFEIQDNFLGGEYMVGDEKVILDGHITNMPFHYAFVTDSRNIICIDADVLYCSSESIKDVLITISVYCHKSNIQFNAKDKIKYKNLGYSGNRLDSIIKEIGFSVNGAKDYGIGNMNILQRQGTISDYPNPEYFGKNLYFKVSDFLRDYTRYRK